MTTAELSLENLTRHAGRRPDSPDVVTPGPAHLWAVTPEGAVAMSAQVELA